jgi:hypothetical protein
VQELSPYEAELDCDRVSEPDEIMPLLVYLGQATAKIHRVSDAGGETELIDFQTEQAISAVLDDDRAPELAEFGAAYGERAREDHRLFVDAFRNGQIPGL